MKMIIGATSLFLLLCFNANTSMAQDWANLQRYKDENLKLGKPLSDENRVVFMGNSITDSWSDVSPLFFERHPNFINRGISGQTTPQMLVRFRPDVIELEPKVVVILAGTNDIAGNTGPSSPEMIMDNLKSMSQLARYNGIDVILCSVLPAYEYTWSPGKEPHKKIPALNKKIKAYAEAHDITYVDYFSAMADEQNGMKKELTKDGVHPTEKGYSVMEPIILDAIRNVLGGF